MAIVASEIYTSAEASVTVTYNDANGAISQLAWRVDQGTLSVLVRQTGRADITVSRTTSGSQAVSGYNLVRGPKGDWAWPGDPSFEISWHS